MIQLPLYSEKLEAPKRYKVLYGGRGSAKSYTIARILLARGRSEPRRILCAREFQNSIHESVHHLLKQEIEVMGMGNFYEVTNSAITGKNGTEFIFKGVRQNIQSIKSIPGITDLWLEEAQTVSQSSWDVLIPTIREPGSEIWVSFNPDSTDDPTFKMFCNEDGSPKNLPDAVILKVNYDQNPWFPKVLKEEKNKLYRVNPDLADHVWGGNPRTHSDAQIFKNKWSVQPFEIEEHWNGPYQGADWGFSVDPTVLSALYVDKKNNLLYVRHAKFGYHTELKDLPELFDQVPNSRQRLIRADCARPETVSHVKAAGFKIQSCEKWKGSVEDGITFLLSFDKIIFHPECTKAIEEAKNYSYKTDRLTGDVLNEIVDAYNHFWDSARYALEPIIKSARAGKFTPEMSEPDDSHVEDSQPEW